VRGDEGEFDRSQKRPKKEEREGEDLICIAVRKGGWGEEKRTGPEKERGQRRFPARKEKLLDHREKRREEKRE